MTDRYDLLIIGAGKYGREVHSLAQDAIDAGAPWRIKGFLDDRVDALAGFDYPTPIIGTVEDYEPRPDDRFLCSVGDNDLRHFYTEIILKRGGIFATLIHPTAAVGRHATLGAGTIVEPFVFVGADASIGSHCLIGSHSCVSHDCRVGDYCQLCGHCSLGGNVTIEDFGFLGLGAVIVPKIVVHRQGFVGAGSVVLANVPPATKVFGSPATMVGKVGHQRPLPSRAR